MNITKLAINRPAAASMVVLLFVVLGLFVYPKIGSDLLPEANAPFISVVCIYPGAGPEEIESEVMEPIEEAVSSISGLKRVTSTASEGRLLTILEFNMSIDADIAAIDVQKAVDAVQRELPDGVEKPAVYKYDFNVEPVMTLALSSQRPLEELYRLADDRIKPALEGTPGVAKVDITGGKVREIQVNVEKDRLELYRLSINQVIDRLYLENFNVPSGKWEQSGKEYTVRVLGQYRNLDEIKNLLIPLPQGGKVALRELAQIKDDYAEMRILNRFDSQDTVGLVIQKQSDAGIVDTAAGLHQEIAGLNQTLPQDVKLVVASDESGFIKNSLKETQRTLLEGVITTGLVLLLFLKEWRSLLIVMLAIPTSIVSTFMMMYFMGYTFNILSLLGLTLCVGILVDDSIVVIENIFRHFKMGKGPARAALDGRMEIGFAAVAITLSDVVVFGPIAFMTGLVGQFFRQFGLTVVFAALFSLFVSFTLTPMLASKLFKAGNEGKPGGRKIPLRGLWEKLDAWNEKIKIIYRRALEFTLRHRWKVIILTMGLFLASVSLIPLGLIGTEFLASPDQGEMTVDLELAPGVSLEKTDDAIKDLEKQILAFPEVEHTFTTVGQGGDKFVSSSGSHLGQIKVILSPKSHRSRSQWEVADSIRKLGQEYPGMKTSVTLKGVVAAQGDMPPLMLELTGNDMDTLEQLSHRVQDMVAKVPGVVDLQSTWREGRPEIQVVVNRMRAAEYGLSVGEISSTVRAALEGETATVFRQDGNEYDVRVKLNDAGLQTVDELKSITLSNYAGQIVRLGQVADVFQAAGPTEIRHQDRKKLITLTGNIVDRPLGDITKEINVGLKKIDFPEGYFADYYGDQMFMEESFGELVKALVLSLVLVYMILVVLYESYLTPAIRMLSLPAGAIGALCALAITGNTLNVLSFIGLIMLDGLAAKNGTLLIDYTHTLMHSGMSLKEALMEAGTTRLRPILMTTVTMIFGVLPAALAITEGSEYRVGMAVVVIGGMITSFLLTPVIIPAAYTIIDDFKAFLRGKREKISLIDERKGKYQGQ